MCGGDRIEVDQANTDSGSKSPAQEVFDIVICTLSTNGVAIVLDQSIEDSIDVGSPNLAKLHVRDEIFDDVVVSPKMGTGNQNSQAGVRS